jgi:hypothetical protein
MDVPSFSKAELAAYWDTGKVIPGEYQVDIVLNYVGKTSEKVFDIVVDFDKITTSVSGNVVAVQEKENQPIMIAIYVLIALVVVLIIFNIVIYLKKK